MERMTPRTEHGLDLLHVLLIVMIAASVLMVFAGVVQVGLQLPVDLS